jgi:mono/diheme cytochrome c family protein
MMKPQSAFRTTEKFATAAMGIAKAITIGAMLLLLNACGGGAETQVNPPTSVAPSSAYTGPAPSFPDVQFFRVSLWENIRTEVRCGACHNAGGQAPEFARSDDVNLAYSAALPLVDLQTPSDSRLVTKVASGHNCWLGTDAPSVQACANIMITWIENWANSANSGSGGRQIVLTAPSLVDPGSSKAFPASSAGFDAIHQLLLTHCAGCHTPESLTPQSPYFANADRDIAYEAAKSKINLDDPADSRLVVRLRSEFHNCWSDCQANATTMQTAIENFAATITADVIDPALVTSKAMRLIDGIIASGGNRYEANQIALWEFKSGTGFTAFDTSGVDPAIDLTISGSDVEWVGGYGINIRSGKAQGSTASSRKLYDAITTTGEYAIEAWVAPANVTQEDAYIVSYSGSDSTRNFTLGQTLYNYDAFNRSSTTDENGSPALSTADADEDLQATLQHVVVNFDPVNGRQIFVNGTFTDDLDPNAGGDIGSWRNNFAFVLGNETSSNRQWQGVIREVAIHNRVLTPEQIVQNFDVGVGQKFFLLFYLGDHITTVPEPYLLIEVSQFDSYSYLFNQPRFISLDPSVTDPGPITIAGMRIGVNGALVDVGQAFQFLDTRDPSFTAPYTPDGQMLSNQGTIISVKKSPDQDQFFLSFDFLGNDTNVFVEPTPLPPGAPADGDPVPDIGLRTFEEINATMATITTVSTQNPFVRDTFERVKQQLPTVENFGGFLAAHQMAIAQMAIEYCNALVDDTAKRAAFWPGFSFPANINNAFGPAADRDLVLDPLINRIALPDAFGNGLTSQPDIAAMKGELNSLTDRLTACYDFNTGTDNCEAGRTNTVVKAICGAALGNAAILVQ